MCCYIFLCILVSFIQLLSLHTFMQVSNVQHVSYTEKQVTNSIAPDGRRGNTAFIGKRHTGISAHRY